jgi:hypothetical protein
MPAPALFLAALLAGVPDGAPGADPTRASLVSLDFRGRTLDEVVRAIEERSGNRMKLVGNDTTKEAGRVVTLEAPGPRPFWEAVDRLSEAAGVSRSRWEGTGPPGSERAYVEINAYGASRSGYGPALYVGPFRLGEFELHMHYRREYVPRQTYTRDLGPFWAQFQVLAEPRILAVRTGPLRGLEATDDRGQSLLGPEAATGGPAPANDEFDLGNRAMVTIPLARPADPGRMLRSLRGWIPVEVAVRLDEPALVVDLAGSAGKSFRAGDVRVTIEDFQAGEGGPTHLAIRAVIEGDRGDAKALPAGLISARHRVLQSHLIEVVGEGGGPVTFPSGGSSAGPEGLSMDYNYSPPIPGQPGTRPTQLLLYSPAWVDWEVPFEFADVPIP